MADTTKISWADKTFNPWIGCTKVSPACDGCYAAHLMETRLGRVTWGAGEDRQRTSPANWQLPRRWNREAEKTGTRPFVFCASLADVFDNEVDPLWRSDLFKLIDGTPNLIWLLLTKRIGNVLKMTDAFRGNRPVPPNAAIGATMANQEEYDRDRMKLWQVKQDRAPAFTFGSFEPLLGPVTLDEHAPDWIITGGETDQGTHKARPSHPEWFRTLRDQSAALGRAFHHKQNGEWRAGNGAEAHFKEAITVPWTRVDSRMPGVRPAFMVKIGKRATGREIDGKMHDAFPVAP